MVVASKNKKNNDDQAPPIIIRHRQVYVGDNKAIPDAKLKQDDNQGRILAFDAKTKLTPVLTSARKLESKKAVEDFSSDLCKGLEGISIHDDVVSTPKKVAVVPKKISCENKKKKRKDDDEEWIEPAESDEVESVSTTSTSNHIDDDDKDDLAWGLNDNDATPSKDPFGLYWNSRAEANNKT